MTIQCPHGIKPKTRCKQCMKEYKRRHYKEYSRTYKRGYKKPDSDVMAVGNAREVANKCRVTNTLTVDEWRALKEFYGYTCLGCERKEPDVKLSIDHVIPMPKGENTILNIQPLCRSCNSRKGRKQIDYRRNHVPRLY